MESFLGKLSRHILDKYKEQILDLTIVFPNKRAALYLQHQFMLDAKEAIWLPKMMSIEEAFCQWSGLQKADPLSVSLELLDIHYIEKPTAAADLNRFISYAAQMSRDFDEVDHYLVNNQQLFSYLNEVKALEAWHPDGSTLSSYEQSYLAFFKSLNTFYERLRERLQNRSMGSYGMISASLARKTENDLVALSGKGKLIFAGFNAFTPAEEEVVNKLVKSGKANLIWDLDEYYTDQNKFGFHEAGAAIRKFLKNVSAPVEFWKNNTLITDKKTIHIIGVPGNVGQAKAMGHYLKISGAAGETAIVLADEKLLIPVLNSIPSEVEKFNVTMGYPFIYSPVYQLLTELFEIAKVPVQQSATPLPSALVMSVLGQLTDICSNNLALLLEFRKMINQLSEISSPYISASWLDSYEAKEHQTVQLLLTRIMYLPSVQSSKLLTEIMSILQLLHDEYDEATNSLVQNQLSEASKLFNRMDQLMAGKYHLLSKEDIGISFRQLSANCSVSFYGEPLHGLQVMGMLETRNLTFETVHLLSANEGLLPAEKSQQSLIPFDVRKTFGMPLHHDRQAISAHHFFRLLQHTSEMFIYYNTEPDELGGGEPSRYVLQLKHELAQLNPRLEIKESLFVQPVKATFNERIITIHKCDEIMEQLRRKAEKGLSPTALSRFVECPLKFYLHDIAEIREKDKVDFNIAANVLGSVIHKCLENLYQPYLHQAIDHKSVEEMMTRLQNELLIAFQAELPDTRFAEGRSRIALDVAKKLVQQLLQFELNQLRSSQQSIYIIDLEKKLETIIQINNIGVKLHGIIDRIDSLNGLTRIIDYKTGVTEKSDVKVADWTELKTHEKAKAFQLSVYQYMWAENNASSEQQHVLSGLYSLRKMSEGLITTHYAMTQNKDEVLEQTEIIIKEILSEILESASPFVQTDSAKICQRCSYAALCLRDK